MTTCPFDGKAQKKPSLGRIERPDLVLSEVPIWTIIILFVPKHEKNLLYRCPHGPSALVIGGGDDINDSGRSRKEEERIASKELSAAAGWH
jgi:hypothetical protein